MALGAERGVCGTQAGLERKAPKTGGSLCTRGWPSTLGLLHPCPLRSAGSICHPEPLHFQTPLNGFCASSGKRRDSHRGGPSPEAPRQLMEWGLELCLLKPAPGQRVFLRQLTPHQGDWYWLSPWRLLTGRHRVLSDFCNCHKFPNKGVAPARAKASTVTHTTAQPQAHRPCTNPCENNTVVFN